MKKTFAILASILITAVVFAQAPQKMSYQAVIRNSTNLLVTSHVVGMKISILQGSVTGTAVYTETQTPTTNLNGLVSIEIGNGTGFDAINWANGPYFIKTETDPLGGTNYTITGTSQLLSVPYALSAKTAETANKAKTAEIADSAKTAETAETANKAKTAEIADSLKGGISETDPVFVASPANGITSTNITSWNNKLDSEVDGSITNELQTLSISHDTIYLSNNGGFVKLPVLIPPTATISAATNVLEFSATLNGFVNAKGLSTPVVF